jgi:metal-dependent amidase/aminoacylase/carboxypeptidase family protein
MNSAMITLSAQKIISRTIDPVKQAVLSFGMIQAGTTDSVIPDQAFCKGSSSLSILSIT